MKLLASILVPAVMMAATPAEALVYVVKGSGTVSSITALDGGTSIAAPSGSVVLGDTMSFSFSFDTDKATLTSLFDADPAINIYYLGVTDFDAILGAYTYNPRETYIGASSF